MMDYQLEKSPGHPLYESLYGRIKEDIMDGVLPYGTKLLSKRALANHLNCSITTVENAYAQLKLEGFIKAEESRGFFVCAERVDRSTKAIREYATDVYFDWLEAEEKEEFLIDFKANQSSLSLFPYSTWSKLMRKVVSSQDPELLKTVPYNGVFALRLAIANYLKRTHSMQVNPAQVIIGAGTEYLYGRLLSLLGNDSIFAIEDPGYKRLAEISTHQESKWEFVPIDDYGISMERLEQSNANIVHVSPSNHFPTGLVMPFSRRQELLNWANDDPNRFIIEDDYDSEIRYTGKPIPPLFATSTRNKVIYLNTFSKSLVPSLRISYMVLPPRLLERYRSTMSFYSCTVSSFEQLTLANFIEDGYFERHINRLRKHYRDRRDLVISAFEASKLSKISKIIESDAGTHFLLRVDTQMSDEEIHAAATQRKVQLSLLSDYSHYFMMRNAGTIVVNYAGIDETLLPMAVRALEEIFEEDLKAD